MIRYSILALLILNTLAPAAEPIDSTDLAALNSKNPAALGAEIFAKTGMIGSAVGITFDDQGRAYVTQTQRRNNAEIDIRKNKDWLPESLALTSPEQRQALIKKRMPTTWQRLADHKETIIRVTDTDGDGKADESKIVFQGLNELGSGLAGGILWHEGALYVTCMPSLWKLTDTDGDSLYETKQELVRGIGYHIGYGGHDMHGPTLGMDGRIYWTSGDKGVHVKLADGSEVHHPGEGGCFRVETDGTGFEVFTRGLRNSQELAFDDRGNLFTVDNDGDFGDQERVHYLMEGSDVGWRAQYQYRSDRSWGKLLGYNPWIAENLWQATAPEVLQPAYLLPAIANFSVGPIGFEYHPGTALSDRWKGAFFLAESSKSIQALRFSSKGAGFTMDPPERIIAGPFITGLSFAPDGALYGANWGDNAWSPHKKGSILRLDDALATRNSERETVQLLIAEGLDKKSPTELSQLLSHPDQRLRLKAQFELVRQSDIRTLNAALDDKSILTKIHALWGLGQLARKGNTGAVPPIAEALINPEAEVRAQAARMLADAKANDLATSIAVLLADPSVRVQSYAAMALRRLGSPKQLPAVLTMISDMPSGDPYLRHAATMALAGCLTGNTAELKTLATHTSKSVRHLAVIAARMIRAAQVTAFLNDGDPLIQAEAALAIHDDSSIAEALPTLASWLATTSNRDPIALRRAISANIRMGDQLSVDRLLAYAQRPDAPKTMRIEALETLACWPTGLDFDRVQGYHRAIPARPIAEARASFAKVFDNLMADPLLAIRLATAPLVKALDHRQALTVLEPLAISEATDPNMRAIAIHTLAVVGSPQAKAAIDTALKSSNASIQAAGLRSLIVLAPKSEASFAALSTALQNGPITVKQQVLGLLATLQDKASETLLSDQLKAATQGKVSDELLLDLRNAAAAMKNLRKPLAAFDAAMKKRYPKDTTWHLARHGGDPAEGKAIFSGSTTAACMQCHTLIDGIPSVGPNLATIASRLNDEQLLNAIINPQAEIAEGYGLISATLHNGSIVSGLLAGETTATLTLRIPATPITQSVQISDIAQRSTPASAMPTMTSLLTNNEVRDLVAYLKTLR
jgi:quinoprotein glucose dehydrogenase